MILNTVSVLLLTFLLVRLDSWSDTVASAVNAFSQNGGVGLASLGSGCSRA